METTSDDVLESFIAEGLPVLPVYPTGEKIPMVSHKFLDNELPTINSYKKFNSEFFYGIKTGNLQTKIECIDFDCKNDPDKDGEESLWNKFKKNFNIDEFYVESTMSGGYHILYMCDTVGSSEKLAYCKNKMGAAIETRGKGSYVVVAPSRGYKTIKGSIFNLPHIDMQMVDEIKSFCRALNERQERIISKQKTTYYQKVYDKKHAGEMVDMLCAQGWSIHSRHDDKTWMTRPGKDKGVSGTIFSSGVFYCFTSSTEYNVNTAYSPSFLLKQKNNLTEEQVEREVCKEAGECYIKDVVIEIIKNSAKLKPIEMQSQLYTTVLNDMEKKGAFFVIEHKNIPMYFMDKVLYEIDIRNLDFCAFMDSVYGLTKTEQYSKKTYESLRAYTIRHGAKTSAYRYCHYSPENNSIYIDNFNGSMHIVTDKDIAAADNGYDGILFLKCNGVPFVYTDEVVDYENMIFGGLTFNEQEYELSAAEYKKLFFCWVLSIFFGFRTRCLVYVIGEKGSGKSVLFKKILTILFGHDLDLKVLPEKEEDFNAIVTNNKVVFFDNVDSNRPWLNERSATCATGGQLAIRKLYETNVEYNVPVDVFLGFTSRIPPSRQDDVADRSIEFPLNRFSEFSSETEIMREVIENRDKLISTIMQELKYSLSRSDIKSMKTHTRIADFEIFCRKNYDNAEVIFEKLSRTQQAMVDDAFTDVFRMFCQSAASEIIEMTSAEICLAIVPLAAKMNFKNLNLTSKSIGHKLKRKFDFAEIEKNNARARGVKYRIKITCERTTGFSSNNYYNT